LFRSSTLSLCLVLAFPLFGRSAVFAGEDDDKIVGTWERVIEKDDLEETWVIKSTKGKWFVSGSYWKRGKNGEVGNFKGTDITYADGTLTFTQEYFKLPQGRENGTKITASVEGDRLDFTAKKGASESKDNMQRAGDASEVLGAWTCVTFGMKEAWTIEKDKKGVLSVRGTFKKDDKEVGSWKGVNVRYFMRTLWFNQEFTKLPTKTWVNGVAIAGVGRGGEFVYGWTNGKLKGKGKVTTDAK
jgi:hypothetical protein